MSFTFPSAVPKGDQPAGRRAMFVLIPVAVMGVGMAWAYRSMRAVMEIGGACATGGPYVPVQPCPDGSWMIAVAIPAIMLSAFAGLFLALSVNAPNIMLWMWTGLFGALGWNFIDFAFSPGDVVVGWLVCGIMFWLMAAPALVILLIPLTRRPPGSYPTWFATYLAITIAAAWFGAWTWSRLA